MPLNTFGRVREHLVLGELVQAGVCLLQEVVPLVWAGQLLDDERQPVAAGRVEFALSVAQRREIDMADLLALLGLRIWPGVGAS